MNIERHCSTERMSQLVTCGPFAYLAGQVAQDPSQDVAGQTRQILAQIDALLLLAGTDKSQLLNATIWLSDIRNFAAMNAVWDAWVDAGHPPARACVEARLARPELAVEIQINAMRPSARSGESVG